MPSDAGLAPPPQLSYAGELKRKGLHVLALIVPLGMLWLGKPTALMLLVPLSLLALTLDILRVRWQPVATVIDRIFGSFMRAEERPPLGGPIVINGATWVMVSATILLAIFPIGITVPAFVSFMLGDAAAALVGRKFGRLTWGSGNKTIEGSLAYLVCGIAVMLIYPIPVLWIGIVSVTAGMFAELMPGPFNDNIRVPFITAVVFFTLAYLFSQTPPALFT